MRKKETKLSAKNTASGTVISDEQDRFIKYASANPVKDVLKELDTSLSGLGEKEVYTSRIIFGSNKLTRKNNNSLPRRIASEVFNPFTITLLCLAAVSSMEYMIFPYFSIFKSSPDDFEYMLAAIILTMIFISLALHFIQKSRSRNAEENPLSNVTTICTVTRRGNIKIKIPLEEIVVGDIVHLSAGDMIPADIRILDAKDLFINQARFTGDSTPVEKSSYICKKNFDCITDYTNIAFMGSNVISGSATAAVISVGNKTLFGSMSAYATEEEVKTSFRKDLNAVS